MSQHSKAEIDTLLAIVVLFMILALALSVTQVRPGRRSQDPKMNIEAQVEETYDEPEN